MSITKDTHITNQEIRERHDADVRVYKNAEDYVARKVDRVERHDAKPRLVDVGLIAWEEDEDA